MAITQVTEFMYAFSSWEEAEKARLKLDYKTHVIKIKKSSPTEFFPARETGFIASGYPLGIALVEEIEVDGEVVKLNDGLAFFEVDGLLGQLKTGFLGGISISILSPMIGTDSLNSQGKEFGNYTQWKEIVISLSPEYAHGTAYGGKKYFSEWKISALVKK